MRQNWPQAALFGERVLGDTKESGYAELLRQQTVLARFGELALRSDDLQEILTEACRLAGDALACLIHAPGPDRSVAVQQRTWS